MDIAAIGSLLGGAGQFAGGAAGLFRGSQSTPDNSTFYQNWRNDDMAWSREQFNRNEALQREFAQNGIQWRVSDAKAAGLHPLAAIGAAGSSYSPTVTAGGGNYNVDFGRNYSSDTGSSLANMGQGLGRAIAATQTSKQREETAFDMIRQRQMIEQGDLQNEYLRSQINKMNGQIGPPMPSAGGPNAVSNPVLGVHEPEPYPTPTSMPGRPDSAAGPHMPSVEWRKNPDGSLYSVPAKGQNMDDISSPGWWTHQFHNTIRPMFGNKDARPPDHYLPAGSNDWKFWYGSWYPIYVKKGGAEHFKHLPERTYYDRPWNAGGWQSNRR